MGKNKNNKEIEIEIENQKKVYPEGTKFVDIIKDCGVENPYDVMLIKKNGKLRELYKRLKTPGKIELIRVADRDGKRVYRRSLVYLLQKAVDDLRGDKKICVTVHHSLSHGYFCRLEGEKIDALLLDKIDSRMRELVKADRKIMKSDLTTKKASEKFGERGLLQKKKLLKYRTSSRVNVYELDGYVDYFYGYMVPSTGYLRVFELMLYADGFILQFPHKDSSRVAAFEPSNKLFKTLDEASSWAKLMGVGSIGELNDVIVKGGAADLVYTQEALMETKIGSIAQEIADKNKKFIMIAGPSSSGKTTFSHRLSTQLYAHGLRPHPIGLDDFYIDRDKCPRDEDGKLDFECLESLDLELIDKTFESLLSGKETKMPKFDFVTGMRSHKYQKLKMGESDILVIEGIHGLNDRISRVIPGESIYKIYISALTQLNFDEHNFISTTDGRLIRRIVRDARTRGTDAKETMAMWESVVRGEEKHIFPYQERADVMFNSGLVYELSVLKTYIEPLLFQIEPEDKEYVEANRLLKFLDYFLAIPSENISKTSVLREFIGGSIYPV